MSNEHRRGKKFDVDWLGLRLTLIIITLVVIFAVFEPFIWSGILHHAAPGDSGNLANDLIIIVAIMTLALGGFGMVIYQLTEKRSEASLEQRATEIKDDLLANAVVANSQLSINISLQAFYSYEKLWRDKNYTTVGLQDREVQFYLDSALSNAKWAVDQFEVLPERLIQREKCRKQYIRAKVNYMYFLATKNASKLYALHLAQELEAEVKPDEYDQRECIAWCYMRFSKPGQAEWVRGLEILASVMNTAELSPTARKARKKRYTGLFGNTLEISDALNGKAPFTD